MGFGARAQDEPPSPCSVRFAEMLRCVEVSGSSVACTPEIDAFLACERTVFRAMQRAAAASTPAANAAFQREPLPEAQLVARAPEPPHDENVAPLGRANAALGTVSRAAAAQTAACWKLVDMCAQEGMATKLKRRCVDIVEEGASSIAIVAGAIVRGSGSMLSRARAKFDDWRGGQSKQD